MPLLTDEGFSEADLDYINEPFTFENLIEIKTNNHDKTIQKLKTGKNLQFTWFKK